MPRLPGRGIPVYVYMRYVPVCGPKPAEQPASSGTVGNARRLREVGGGRPPLSPTLFDALGHPRKRYYN